MKYYISHVRLTIFLTFSKNFKKLRDESLIGIFKALTRKILFKNCLIFFIKLKV